MIEFSIVDFGEHGLRQYISKRPKEGWATARYASHSFAGSNPAAATVSSLYKNLTSGH